jgi:hypothetical protein
MTRARLLHPLLVGALFLGSFLLFLIEPWQGRLLLPLLGGTPAVWNACMLFFQAALLLGYGYAHLLATRFTVKRQLLIHALVMLLPFALLPLGLPSHLLRSPLLSDSPLTWLFQALTFSSGPLFFVLSTTSPLLQSWFARASDRDPYRLYAAGNLGSLLALIGYPLLIEPNLRLSQQASVMTGAYVLLVVLIGLAGALLLRTGTRAQPALAPAMPVTWPQRLTWTALAFTPSSLMLGVTTFLTTDIAPIPMLWTLPLALYIGSFVMVFSRAGHVVGRLALRALPFALVPVLFLIFAGFTHALWLTLSLHLLGFFVAALACHGRLAALRPEPARLTEFYFCLAVGGALGGLFNTLLSPLLFVDIAEYPLAVGAALLLCRLPGERRMRIRTGLLIATFFALLMIVSLLAARVGHLDRFPMALFGAPLLLVFVFARQPAKLTAAALGIILVATFREPSRDGVHRERSFFGSLTVLTLDPGLHELLHGGIVHTQQRWRSDEERHEPRTYFHRAGPLGRIMDEVTERIAHPRVAVIGLGGGTIAAYCDRRIEMTFFELDPNVERVARNASYFTYMRDAESRGCQLSVVIGDGRLRIGEAAGKYDLIIVDAFSSDAIPVHLITTEALAVYRSRLAPDGVIAFHISNGYVNLEPVLHNLAQGIGWRSVASRGVGDDASGCSPSHWVALAPSEERLRPLTQQPAWQPTLAKAGLGVWNDDYANVVSVFRWQ